MLEAIFLYLILHDDNSRGERFRTQMPSMAMCMEVVSNAKMPMPKSTNDYEVLGVMFCGTEEFHTVNNYKWLKVNKVNAN